MIGTKASSKAEWAAHWPLVLAACLGFSFVSFLTPALGVFMGPLEREFGWDRTQLSAGLALSAGIAILLSPFVGAAIDRWGVRRLALPGLALNAAAVASFSMASGSFGQWIALWLIWGVLALLIQSTLWSTAVASVFRAGRGLALGVTMSGTALAQILAPPLCNALIASQGWRQTFVIVGLGWGGVALLVSLLFLHAGKLSLKPDLPGLPTTAQGVPGLTINQAWRDPSLWKIAISTFLVLTATIAVVVHQFPILIDAGISRERAAWLVSLSGVAGVAGKLVTGSLVDRFHVRWIGGLTLASTAIAWPLFLESFAATGLVIVGILISGYAAGTKMQLCSYLTARYAGMRNYGAIFGFMTSMISLASMIGPLAAGAAFDATGSYSHLLLVGVAISLVSGLIVFSLGAYPDWDDAPQEQAR